MKKVKKIVCFIILMGMLFVFCSNKYVTAAEKATEKNVEKLPATKLSIKKINKGTGIKITWTRVKGADNYTVKLKGYSSSYKGYVNPDNYRTITTINESGKQKYSYVIKGLGKGKYCVCVNAVKRSDNSAGFINVSNNLIESPDVTKTFKIKAAKESKRKSIKYDFSKVKLYDTITFGAYEQDADVTNGKEPIEWIVISKSKGEMLVVSKYILDSLPYNATNENEATSWKQCTVRDWLNKVFYNTAFITSEKKMIKNTKLINSSSTKEEKESIEIWFSKDEDVNAWNTKDKVFLLSGEDLESNKNVFHSESISDDIFRRAIPTSYAKLQGAETDYFGGFDKNCRVGKIRVYDQDGNKTESWLLRIDSYIDDFEGMGAWKHSLQVISNAGKIVSVGKFGNSNSKVLYSYGIRPAMIIKDKSIKAAKKSEYKKDKDIDIILAYLKLNYDNNCFKNDLKNNRMFTPKVKIRNTFMGSPEDEDEDEDEGDLEKLSKMCSEGYKIENEFKKQLDKFYPLSDKEQAKMIIEFYENCYSLYPRQLKKLSDDYEISIKYFNNIISQEDWKKYFKKSVDSTQKRYTDKDALYEHYCDNDSNLGWFDIFTKKEIKDMIYDILKNQINIDQLLEKYIQNGENPNFVENELRRYETDYDLDFSNIDLHSLNWKQALNNMFKKRLDLISAGNYYRTFSSKEEILDEMIHFEYDSLCNMNMDIYSGWYKYFTEKEIKTAFDKAFKKYGKKITFTSKTIFIFFDLSEFEQKLYKSQDSSIGLTSYIDSIGKEYLVFPDGALEDAGKFMIGFYKQKYTNIKKEIMLDMIKHSDPILLEIFSEEEIFEIFDSF